MFNCYFVSINNNLLNRLLGSFSIYTLIKLSKISTICFICDFSAFPDSQRTDLTSVAYHIGIVPLPRPRDLCEVPLVVSIPVDDTSYTLPCVVYISVHPPTVTYWGNLRVIRLKNCNKGLMIKIQKHIAIHESIISSCNT